MALATREHKRYFYSTILTAQNILFLEALAQKSKPAYNEFVHSRGYNSSTMSGRSASISVASDAMVCVECFRMKGDQDLKAPCQNPRCYFYLQVPGCDPQAQRDSMSSGPTFNKEVGCDRSGAAAGGLRMPMKPRPSQSSDFLLSQCGDRCGGQGMNGIWAFKPENKAYMGKLTQPGSMIKMRSQSTSMGGNCAPIATSLKPGLGACHRANNTVLQSSSEVEKARLMRARMMSMPGLVAGMESALMDGGGHSESDLVEDAFLSSPLPEFATTAERGLNPGAVGQKMHCLSAADTDTDSGIGSPFGGKLSSTSSAPDWMHHAKASSSSSSSSPYPLSPYRVTFDMNALKINDTSSNSACPPSADAPHSYTDSARPSGSSSPDSANDLLRRFIMNEDNRDILIASSSKETYSRKVFVGGLPPDIDEEDIRSYFLRFGAVTVDWPHKSHSKGCIPPKGYAFLLCKEESSVHKLLLSCTPEADKYFIFIPTSTFARKKVQIRPWYIVDSQYVVDRPQPLDSRKAIFVGGVPRPLKASELAQVMEDKYGNVTFVGIDCDNDLKYPKGAACVVFSTHASYIAAVSARFMQLNYGNLDKKIEIKPYVLDNQVCDECHGVQCDGKPAPFFCGSVTCLQYYCEYCWATVHSMPGRQNHRPLLKDIGDRARYY